MPRPQWFVVARRELIERVRTRWFIIVTLLGPVAMVGMLVIPALLAAQGADERVRIVVVDDSSYHLGKVLRVAASLLASNIEIEMPDDHPTEQRLRDRIHKDEIDGFMLVPADIDRGQVVRYRGDNATNLAFVRILYEVVNRAVQLSRAERAGLSDEQIAELFAEVAFRPELDTGTGKTSSGAASFIIGYAAMFIVYIAIILYAVNVLRSVVQEKTSRVVEMVVSSTKPRALMLGKILGVGSVGLIQLGTWGLVALLLIRFRTQVLGVFGVSAGHFDIPAITVDEVAVILSFFLLGYFFYAAIYAAIGAMVNSDQEGQQAQTPVVILLVIPVLCVQLVANDPRSFASALLTTIPLSSPVLMPMRYILGGVDVGGLLLALAVLAVSTALVVLLSARIYRVGILMYGKRPTLAELYRWLRH